MQKRIQHSRSENIVTVELETEVILSKSRDPVDDKHFEQ